MGVLNEIQGLHILPFGFGMSLGSRSLVLEQGCVGLWYYLPAYIDCTKKKDHGRAQYQKWISEMKWKQVSVIILVVWIGNYSRRNKTYHLWTARYCKLLNRKCACSFYTGVLPPWADQCLCCVFRQFSIKYLPFPLYIQNHDPWAVCIHPPAIPSDLGSEKNGCSPLET
jgi:hypothetical protein